ncbi:MAG: inositol monophosphatase family protein [Planctomycetia bacterium]
MPSSDADLSNPSLGAALDPLAVCEAAARAGGRVLADWRGRFTASVKGPRDLVTEADLASQEEIRRIVLGAFPEHGFVGEETIDGHRAAVDGTRPRWIVDPLDGTSNYVHGFPAYCVSVALAQGDELLVGAIYDPMLDECFTARRGGGARCNGATIKARPEADPAAALVAVSFPPHVTSDAQSVADFLAVVPHVHSVRRTGSTAINLAYVACGRLDAFWVRRIACWDVAAGLLIAREAGAAIGPFEGESEASATRLDHPAFIVAGHTGLLSVLRGLLGPEAVRAG